jgi:hypothetical protein
MHPGAIRDRRADRLVGRKAPGATNMGKIELPPPFVASQSRIRGQKNHNPPNGYFIVTIIQFSPIFAASFYK